MQQVIHKMKQIKIGIIALLMLMAYWGCRSSFAEPVNRSDKSQTLNDYLVDNASNNTKYTVKRGNSQVEYETSMSFVSLEEVCRSSTLTESGQELCDKHGYKHEYKHE